MFNAKLNSWCTYHTISKCGEVANERGRDLQLLCPDRLRQSGGQLRDAESVDQEYVIKSTPHFFTIPRLQSLADHVCLKFINAAGQFGRAAGKLYIATGSSTKIQTFSGFWLDDIYFVTCCHWEAYPDSSRTNAMYQEMMCPNSQHALVSSADKSFNPGKFTNPRLIHN